MLKDLLPQEVSLVGDWISQGGRPNADETCQRIEWLVENRLRKLARDESGWYVLYEDPVDGRLWEHSYPKGDMHGGGPPALTVITLESARAKYKKP